jgi:hypothetical protein
MGIRTSYRDDEIIWDDPQPDDDIIWDEDKPQQMGTAGVIWEGIKAVPREIASSAITALQGQEGVDVVNPDWGDRFVAETERRGRERVERAGNQPALFGLTNTRELAQLPQNIGFSAGSMGIGIPAGMASAAVSAPVLGPAAPAAGWAAGMAAGGTYAYRAASGQIMRAFLESQNDEKIRTTGQPLTAQEQDALKADFDSKATQYGLWEAVPEAIGSAGGLKILTAPLMKIGGKSLVKSVLERVAGLYGEELATETITQQGQHNLLADTPLSEGEKRSWGPSGIAQSFKEVAPQTIMLSSIMAPLGIAAGGIRGRESHDDSDLLNPDFKGRSQQIQEKYLGSVAEKLQNGEWTIEDVKADYDKLSDDDPIKQALAQTFLQARPDQPTTGISMTGPNIYGTATPQQIKNQEAMDAFAGPVETQYPTGQEAAVTPALQPAPGGPQPSASPRSATGAGIQLPPSTYSQPVDELQVRREEMRGQLRQSPEDRSREARSQKQSRLLEQTAVGPIEAQHRLNESNRWGIKIPDDVRSELERIATRSPEEPISEQDVTWNSKEQERIDQQANEAATSPMNDRPEPTPAQVAAGNYKKGQIRLRGLDISIENPEGSTRQETKPEDAGDDWEPAWKTTMQKAHYGYFKGANPSNDGDAVDVFVSTKMDEGNNRAYVIDQIDPKTGKYDEPKVILGAKSEADARDIYLSNYEPGWKGLGAITEMKMIPFRKWLQNDKHTKPIGDISNAESLRENEGQIQGRGTERPGVQEESGQNLQQEPETRAETGNTEQQVAPELPSQDLTTPVEEPKEAAGPSPAPPTQESQNKTAQDFNKAYPGNDIKYDGEQSREEINKPPLYNFTVQSGPAARATFSLEDPTVENIKAKLDKFSASREKIRADKERKVYEVEPGKKKSLSDKIDEAIANAPSANPTGTDIEFSKPYTEKGKKVLQVRYKPIGDVAFGLTIRGGSGGSYGIYRTDPIVGDKYGHNKESLVSSHDDLKTAKKAAIDYLEGKLNPDGMVTFKTPTGAEYKILNSIGHLERFKAAALKAAGVKFSTTSYPAGHFLNQNSIIDAFKAKGLQADTVENLVRVKTASKYIYIDVADTVVADDETAIRMGYGREPNPGEKVAGSFSNLDDMSDIRLKRFLADNGTLEHELWHFVKNAGVLKPLEIAAIERAAGMDEEAQARWIETKLRERGQEKGIIPRALQSIADFIDALINIFHKTQRGILRKMESGEFLKRPSVIGEVVDNFSTRPQTESESFKKWFGDSKVVDENGDPLVVYHGTASEFNSFDVNKSGSVQYSDWGPGIYFTPSKWQAEGYSEDARKSLDEKSNALWNEYESKAKELGTTPMDASIDLGFGSEKYKELQKYHDKWINRRKEVAGQDSKIVSAYIKIENPYNYTANSMTDPYLSERAKDRGHDGIIIRREDGSIDEIIAFNPTQIKSATENVGTFDPNNPDIRFSTRTPNQEGGVKSWITREKNAAVRTLIAKLPRNMPALTMTEQLLKSPEWYDHPVVKKIVRFAIDRHDLFYENYNSINKVDDPGSEYETVTDATQALKTKGLNRLQILKGRTSEDFKQLQEMVDYGDTNGAEFTGKTLEDRLEKFEQYFRDKGFSEDAINTWRFHRDAYDKALEKLLAPMRELQARSKERSFFAGFPENSFDKFMSTRDDKGKKEWLSLAEVIAQMESWRGFYAPRVRDAGRWVVKGTKGPPGYQQFARYHRTTRLSAERLAEKLKTEGYDIKVEENTSLSEDVLQHVKTMATAELLDKAAENISGGAAVDAEAALRFHDELVTQVADMIRARGFRSTMIHRKEGNVVRGYIEDPLERYVRYTANTASGLAKAETAYRMTDTLFGKFENGERVGGIDAGKEPRAYQVAQKYIMEQLRNADSTDRVVGLAKALTTIKYLGFNPRAAFVNATAMVTTVPAALRQYATGGKASFVRVGNALAGAGKDYALYMKNGKQGGLTDAEFAYLNEIKANHYDDPQYTRDAIGLIRSLHGRGFAKTMNWAMYLFGKTEQWNRGATMLAAYRLAEGGNEARKEAARLVTEKAHGVYGRATLPSWAQGSNPAAKIGQMIYVYQKFGHNWMQLMYDLGFKQKDLKSFAWALGSPIVLGGAATIPLKSALTAIVGAIMSSLGDDRDPEKIIWDSVRKNLGDTAEKGLRYGVAGLAGLDISGSLSFDPTLSRDIADYTGAIGGVVNDIATAGRMVSTGQPLRAAESFLPTVATNALKASREYSQGATTQKGNRVFDEKNRPYMPSGVETGLRAAGFRSSRRATVQSRSWESKKNYYRFKDRRDAIYEAYKAYLSSKDPDQHKKVLDKIREYNTDIRRLGLRKQINFITKDSLLGLARRMRKPQRSFELQ